MPDINDDNIVINVCNSNDSNQNNKIFYVNELLAYLCFYIHNSTLGNIRKSIVNFYSYEDIIEAKKLLWEIGKSSLDAYTERRTTDRRTCSEASLDDMVEAIKKLDIMSNLPSFVARNIENIPSRQPEEVNLMYIVSRINGLENKMGNVDDALINVDIAQQKIKEEIEPHKVKLDDLTAEFSKLKSSLSSYEFLNEIFNHDFIVDIIDNIFKSKYSANCNCTNLYCNNNEGVEMTVASLNVEVSETAKSNENSFICQNSVPVEPIFSLKNNVPVELNKSLNYNMPVQPNSSSNNNVPVEPNISLNNNVPDEPNISLNSNVPDEPNISLNNIVPIEPNISLNNNVPDEPNISLNNDVPVDSNNSLNNNVPVEPKISWNCNKNVPVNLNISEKCNIDVPVRPDNSLKNNAPVKPNISFLNNDSNIRVKPNVFLNCNKNVPVNLNTSERCNVSVPILF